jgi:hypothetical protein
VTSPAGCTLSASSSASCLTITSGASYSGSASVAYSIAANTAQSARTGTMTIAGGTFTVTQAAQSCTLFCGHAIRWIRGSSGVSRGESAGCLWAPRQRPGSLAAAQAIVAPPRSASMSHERLRRPTGTKQSQPGVHGSQAALLLVCTLGTPSRSVRRAAGDDDRNGGCAWTASSARRG